MTYQWRWWHLPAALGLGFIMGVGRRNGDLRVRDLLSDAVVRWSCLLRGHKWEPQKEYYPGVGTHYESDQCQRCCKWKT